MAVNAYVHPAILYGHWHNYNGGEVAEAPLFYQGMDQFAADIMTGTFPSKQNTCVYTCLLMSASKTPLFTSIY